MTSLWESIQKANLTYHKVAPFSLWLKPSNSYSQVIGFSGDYRNHPFSACNTRKISFVWLSCLTALYSLFLPHSKLAYDLTVSLPISVHWTSQVPLLLLINSAHLYYPLGTENFPEPLALPYLCSSRPSFLALSSSCSLQENHTGQEGVACVTAQS